MQKAIGNSATNQEELMEKGSVLTATTNGMASDSCSLVVEIEMDKMPEHYGDGASERLMEASESDATSIMEKGSCCSSWVSEMEEMLEDAKPSVEMARWNRHSIDRVPHYIKHNTNSEAYSPLFVSLGPLHHGEPHLLPMEEHKRRAVAHIVNRSGRPLHEFVAAIDEMADELQAAYNDLDDKWCGANKGRFVEMMVIDGCFLLERIREQEFILQGIADKDYATNDPIFSNRSGYKLWSTMRRDLICMENQIPLVVLQRLLAVEYGTSLSCKDINMLVANLLGRRLDEESKDDEIGLHFLDIYHKSYCWTSPQWEGSSVDYEPRMPCAMELREAGVQFKKSDSIHDVNFENSVLTMPHFQMADSTETILLNMMAFEWLHLDVKHDNLAYYIGFMASIIESERDVAFLRSKGLLENIIGSDKKAVEIFNTLTKLARPPMRGSKLCYVNWKVNNHCKKRQNRWRAIFMNTYLRNPWVIASTVAAFFLLVATLLQTVYTVVPFYTKG